MLTMLVPQHALNEACKLAYRNPKQASDIARRVLACPRIDSVTEQAAFSLVMTLRRFGGR